MKKEDGGPAYPSLEYDVIDRGEAIGQYASGQGMSLRDWYAGMALQGILSNGQSSDRWNIEEWAYKLADAMLKEKG